MLKSTLFSLALVFAASSSMAQLKPQHVVNPRWQPAFDAANKQLHKNLKHPTKRNPNFKAFPNNLKYQAVYLWDSAFISLIWKHQDLSVAQSVIKSVLHNQEPDGRVPHQVNIFSVSKWSQPPLLTWAAVKLTEQKSEQDMAFIREIYPKLKRFHSWYQASHRSAAGLYFWVHGYESGIDNAPRFSNRDESVHYDIKGVEHVDLSAYMVMDAEALSKMALALGLNAEATAYSDEAKNTAKLVRDRLWNSALGNFHDLDTKTGKFITHNTIASLFPLTAGIADGAQAALLMERVKSPKGFNTLIPFPTVERGDPTYEKDMWRGPVWINTAYLALEGVKRYGQMATFNEMASRLANGVYMTYHNTGTFYEFYDSDRWDIKELTRKKGMGPLGLQGSGNVLKIAQHLIMKQIILGQKPVDKFMGWTGLVNTLVIEEKLSPPQ